MPKVPVSSLILFMLTIFVSLSAEFWINNEPLVVNYNQKMYYPIFKKYLPEDYGIKDEFVMDYSKLDKEKIKFILWPLIPWNPYQSDLSLDKFPSAPGVVHFLGTDDRGRDLLARIIYGYRNTILFALSCLLISYSIGILIGVLMGYYRGLVDLVGMRLIEIIESIPSLFLVILLVSLFEPGIFLLATFLSFLSWVKIASQVRAQILKIQQQDYVSAARTLGMGDVAIMIKHLLPNSLGAVYTLVPFSIINFISFLSVVDFLGMGLPPPAPSWGELFQQSQANLLTAPWIFWFPALFMLLLFTLLVRVGQHLEKSLI